MRKRRPSHSNPFCSSPFCTSELTKGLPASLGGREAPPTHTLVALFCSPWPCLQAYFPNGQGSNTKLPIYLACSFQPHSQGFPLCLSPPVLIWAKGNKTFQAQSTFAPIQLSPVLSWEHTLQAWLVPSPHPIFPFLGTIPRQGSLS